MNWITLISVLIISLVSCENSDPILICVSEKSSNSFKVKTEDLEKHLVECQLLDDIRLNSFRRLIKGSKKDQVLNCFKSFKLEGPSLTDLSTLEDCCRSINSTSHNLCDKIIELSEQGISINLLESILDSIEPKHWNENPELRGIILYWYYYAMIK